MSKNSRLSMALLCVTAVFLLACRAEAEDVDYWMKMRTILQGPGTDFEPFRKAAEYAETLSFEQLSVLDGQSLSDTELQQQVTEQEFELIAAAMYTQYFEKRKISLDDFLNDMTANKRRHTAIWTYTCLTSALPMQDVQKLDAEKAGKLYEVLKAQVLYPEAKPMATSTGLALLVSTVKGVPALKDKLPETADMLIQTLLKFGEKVPVISEESAMMAADQFKELKPLIDRDPEFKGALKAKLADAAGKSTNKQLKSLLLSLATFF